MYLLIQKKLVIKMIKFLTLRVIRWRLKNTFPKVNNKLYKNLFTLSYKFFYFLKPSQLWVIILALLNKTEFKKFISIPSIFILLNSLFSDSFDSKGSPDILYTKLQANNLTDSNNNWENFFWIVIALALINRFIFIFFRILWIPFKIAFIYYILKYFGFDFSNIFNFLNNLSLGVIDWFYQKIINFFKLFNHKNDNN